MEGRGRHFLPPCPSLPTNSCLSKEFRKVVDDAVEKLPVGQREVITLRDIEGLPRMMSAVSSASPRATSGSCSTGRGRRSGSSSSAYMGRTIA